MGFPLELITMLGSTLLGGVMSIWGQALKARIENNKMLLQRAEFRAGAVNTAREYGKVSSKGLLEQCYDNLVKEGRRPYVIPVGGSNSLGTWGYL